MTYQKFSRPANRSMFREKCRNKLVIAIRVRANETSGTCGMRGLNTHRRMMAAKYAATTGRKVGASCRSEIHPTTPIHNPHITISIRAKTTCQNQLRPAKYAATKLASSSTITNIGSILA